MKLTTVSDPAHVSQLIHAKITNIMNWKLVRNSYFLKMFFFSFRLSLKMFLNGKQYTCIISINNSKNNAKMKKKIDD